MNEFANILDPRITQPGVIYPIERYTAQRDGSISFTTQAKSVQSVLKIFSLTHYIKNVMRDLFSVRVFTPLSRFHKYFNQIILFHLFFFFQN